MVGDSEENDDCVIADEMIYMPEVRNEKRPKVGMKFDSLDFVYDFYNRYALLADFSIRRHSSGREKYSKEILRKEFVCCKQDATSRRAYGFYGDVVVLDTTFNTNRYGLPFAPMLGVNNHGQTIVLACAFLSKETTESFIWMFEEFKKAMPGVEPKMIITYQDAAMARAIFEVFPTTFPRLCIWHITTKFSDKLPRTTYEEYWKEFKETIWEIDNIDEFEEKWHAIITKSGLTDHPWLSSVFDLRKSWVPAYVKHIFAAGMSSSQRAEGSHAFFKQYISRRNSLMDFITRFQRALSHQRQKELLADHIDTFEKPQCAVLLTMDKQMAEIYTKTMFQKFEQELMQSLPCFMELKMDDASKAIYKVSERKRGKTRVIEVVYDKYSDQWSCSCKGFEFIGILCCHALALLEREQIEYLPNKYILNRWKKTAKSGLVLDSNGNEIKDCENNSLLIKRSRMSRLASDVIEHALMSEKGCELLSNNLNDTRVMLKLLNDGVGPSKVGGSSSQTRYLKDPKRVTHKGSSKRVKGAKEMRMERGIRHCQQCGQTSHDIRRCPRMANTS
ncbi:hypothetical protein L3X38_023590 [Prunus dulcis]|uniref:Protein FAR1-RELATED SEQUENCE n=1 Tax=Prunus dulcis TaxID=3755 RepID=A0AAD4Z5Q0_PRUDU|nr:hypothetical protein L3X38_023590 [Prunus dulcis]